MTERPAFFEHMDAKPSASGWRRLRNRVLHRVACATIPPGLRHSFGLWTWAEVLSPHRRGGYDPLVPSGKFNSLKPSPVERLVRWGVPCSKTLTPWPRCFQGLSNTGNWTNRWDRIPPWELHAWLTVWAQHPLAKDCRERALAGVAGFGNASAVDFLLRVGTDPTTKQKHVRSPLASLWGAEHPEHERLPLPIESLRATWAAFQSHEGPLNGAEIEDKPWYRARPVSEFEALLDAGLPLPPARVIRRWAFQLVTDPSFSAVLRPSSTPEEKPELAFSEDSKEKGFDALAFWIKHCPSLQESPTQGILLAQWVKSSRSGDDSTSHEVARQWLNVLMGTTAEGQNFTDRPLPPVPDNETSWGHVFVKSIFCENISAELRAWLCSADPVFRVKNADGKNVVDCVADRTHDSRSQSRDVGFSKLNAWARSRSLDLMLPAASASASPRPRF